LPAGEERGKDSTLSVDNDTNGSYGGDSETEVVNKPPTKKLAAEETSNANRPKKRRRIAEDDSDAERVIPPSADVINFDSGEQQPHPISHRSPTPLATLPSFPLPALPNTPPKSVLALQGLGRALVDAEIVDPTTLLPIPLDADDDAGTGLTEKTRRRLKELGIMELFAGLCALHLSRSSLIYCTVQTALLPFLLPSNRFQRGLYLPYDPPRDVCVSAPTGSGKTLAYVLPIIEVCIVF